MEIGLVAKNTAWLGLVQVANTALPLLTVPIISRSFGPAVYGNVASLTALASYAGLVVTFGFHLSGPRAVVRASDDPIRLLNEFSAIYSAQVGLAAVASVVFLMLLPLLGYRDGQWAVGALILSSVICSALTPVWMFAGLQKMKQVAVCQLVTRLCGAAAILLTVKNAEDVLFFAFINAASSFACFFWCMIELRLLGYSPQHSAWRLSWGSIRTANKIFVSSIAINLYTASNVIVVSLIAGPAVAGYFSLADRIRGAAVGVLDPVSQALYPYLCDNNDEEAILKARHRRTFFQFIMVLSVCAALTLYFVAPLLADLLGGQRFREAVPILKVLAATPVLICFNNLLGLQVMLPLNMEFYLSRIVIIAAALGLPLVIIATWAAGAIGTAAAYSLVEFGIAIAEMWVISRTKSIVGLFY